MTLLKKVLILSSTGGYGHCAAASTLTHLLEKEWQASIFHPINELRLYGCPCGEALYNFVISRNYTGLTNWAAGCFAPYQFQTRVQKTIRLIKEQLIREKAQLLISVIPYINYPASEAARLLGIPFLLVTTDNDLTNWVYGLENMVHEQVKITIGSDLALTRGLLERRNVPSEVIETIGLPLRTSFLAPADKQRLRFQRGISASRSVVLLMMGGAGGNTAYDYAKILAKLPLNLHLIVCAGRNRHLAERLSSLTLDPENRLEIVPFTEKVHELMAVSDLMITKPGPGSINEAMALKIPLILDRTSAPVYWEEINIDFVQSRGVGKAIYSLENLGEAVRQMLDPETRKRMDNAYQQLPANLFHFRLPFLIDDLCPQTLGGYAALRL